MNKRLFGYTEEGKEIYLYTLANDAARLVVSTFGAAVVVFEVYGIDIAGGFDSVADYLADTSHQGGVIGRVANRIGGARFTMDGVEYTLPNNDNGNCLHGGNGYDRRVWQVVSAGESSITLSLADKDGEEGFPSRVDVTVTYTLDGTSLRIDYRAIADGKTPVSLTNHTYFNLNGLGGDVLEHKIRIDADRYTEVGDNLIPTGNRPEVKDTSMDLTRMKRIGDGFDEGLDGYDHNYILRRDVKRSFGTKELHQAAKVIGDKLMMSVWCDQEGVQFYTGNFLGEGPDFKGGVKQIKHGAFCLETQSEPDSVSHGRCIYESGEVYTHCCVYEVEKI